MSDVPVCIDISHHQGYDIDWDAVRASGVLGIIHKATEGSTFIDDAWADNCAAAKQAGLAVATYFWIKPGDGRAQAEFYLQTIEPLNGERVVIDYEEDGCTLTTLCDAVQAILDYGCDLQICIYSGHLLKEQLEDSCNDFLAKHTTLWLAQYTSSEDDISWCEGTWPQWSLWQYSESGKIAGIDDCYVDLNNFNGSDEDFLTWMGPKAHAPKPPRPKPPRPETEMVSVTITAPDNVAVQVSVNGVTARQRLQRPRRRTKRGPDILR